MNPQKIAILTDSCSDVPPQLAEKYNIYIVPMVIRFSDKEYLDGVEVSPAEIYERLPHEIPKTSLPSGDIILRIFDQIKADGYEKVLAITLSSGLSGTNNFIKLMAEQYEGLEIFVIDSKNISLGSGFNAVQAAVYLEQGMDWETLKARVQKELFNSKVFFCLGTLEYLQKGGRIGLLTSLIGNALGLKPIISCNEEGIYYTMAKVRGYRQSIQRVLKTATEFARTGKAYNIALCNGCAPEEAASIREELQRLLPDRRIYVEAQIGPALGVHTGPGLVGVAVQLLEE